MSNCRISLVYEVQWNPIARATAGDSIRRQRSRIFAAQMNGLLSNLGYTQLSEYYWISPVGNEATLVSVLSYKILGIPGLKESLVTLFTSKVTDSPLDLLKNMDLMVDSLETIKIGLARRSSQQTLV